MFCLFNGLVLNRLPGCNASVLWMAWVSGKTRCTAREDKTLLNVRREASRPHTREVLSRQKQGQVETTARRLPACHTMIMSRTQNRTIRPEM